MRRALTIIAILIVLVGIAVAIYFLFFAKNSGLVVAPAGQNPFGAPSGNTTSSENTSGDTGAGSAPTAGVQVAPHLIKLTNGPVARGFLVLDASSTAAVSLASTTAPTIQATPSVVVKYIDRASGNMYSYDLSQGTSIRLTNHTAPGVEEAAWLGDGSLAFIRFLTTDPDKTEHIDTYALPADGSDGHFLARDLEEVVTQGTTVFTLAPNTNGSVGSIVKPDGSSGSTLFTSPLSSLTLSFIGANLLAYTKPSANLDGYGFLVDRKSGAFTKLVGPLSGLTMLGSPSGNQALVSYEDNGSTRLALYDLASHALTTLPISTFTDKCVWAADSQSAYCGVPKDVSAQDLPDSWYQGTTAFTDGLWKIDLVARVATLVADLPNLSKDPIDAVSLSVDKNDSALIFMNKRDGSLWAYTF